MGNKISKLSNSAINSYVLDHYFYYLFLKLNGEIYNLKGAMLDFRWEVAFIAMKDVLFWGIQVYIYMRGCIIKQDYNKYYIYYRFKDILDNNDLYNDIINIEYLCLESYDDVEKASKRVLEIIYDELNLRKYIEYTLKENSADFEILLETFVLIDEIGEIGRNYKYAYPKEINQQFLKLSRDLSKK